MRLRSGAIQRSLGQGKENVKIELSRRYNVMQKMFSALVFSLLTTILLPTQIVNGAEQDPVKFITEFYTWYISAPNSIDVANSKDVYKYIAKETLEEIKIIPDRPGRDRTDYFLKLSSGPVDMNGVSILVNQVETLGTDTLVAAVTIVHIDKAGHRFPDGLIVVILKVIEGEFKIFKCIDVYPEA